MLVFVLEEQEERRCGARRKVRKNSGDLPGGPVVRNMLCNEEGEGWNPGEGTKSPLGNRTPPSPPPPPPGSTTTEPLHVKKDLHD